MTETAGSDERAEVVVLHTVTTPWIELESWVADARNYIDRTLAKINKPEGDQKLELPPPLPDPAPWMQVRLFEFSVENADQFELGRVVVRADDPEKRAYVALPVTPPAAPDKRAKATTPTASDNEVWWVRQIGETEITYKREATAPPEKEGSRPRPERLKVAEVVEAIPIGATASHSDFVAANAQWSIAVDLHRTAVSLYEVHVCRAALRLLNAKALEWPREPLSPDAQTLLAVELIQLFETERISETQDKSVRSAIRKQRNIDDLRSGRMPADSRRLEIGDPREGERLSPHQAVAVVYATDIDTAAKSPKGTDPAGLIRDKVRDYRKGLSKRRGQPVDPLFPTQQQEDAGCDPRSLASTVSMRNSIERALSNLHLYARQLVALAKISAITKFENGAYPEFRRAWLAARRAAAQLRPGSAEYRAAVAARNHAVQYCALSRHVTPEQILNFAPDLIDRLVDGPIDHALEQEVLDTARRLLALQRSKPQD